jgi:diguanylate cyclase (GGDEF)-like protein
MSDAMLKAEIARLNKIIQALMDRAERNENVQGSDFNLFHTSVLLEEQVRQRTEQLNQALEENERIMREVEALNRKLQVQVIHDPLTGLFNRRYLDEVLERELALARRKGYAVSVVMSDIDHFKAVNDRYGHQTGDEVLKAFADLLVKRSRVTDICCRYGGEEFLLVMPEVPLEVAIQRAEAMRSALHDMSVRSDADVVTVTASFGVASFPQHGERADHLTSAADAALYQAKEAGRDRVMAAD